MDNSIYVTLSRQLALFRDMDSTANNIANANTVGYDTQRIQFSSFLTHDINQGDRNPMSLAHNISAYRDLEPGPMKSTNNPLDLTIQGPGYFAVETPLGTRYSRAGNLTIAADGTLTTVDGYAVLDNAGQHIEFPEGTSDIDIGSIGNIKADGEDFATIGLHQFENEQLLERLGNNLFATDLPSTPPEEGVVRVVQGTLEGSDVKPVVEMTRMIKISRAVADTAQFINIIYDLERKASNAWAQQG